MVDYWRTGIPFPPPRFPLIHSHGHTCLHPSSIYLYPSFLSSASASSLFLLNPIFSNSPIFLALWRPKETLKSDKLSSSHHSFPVLKFWLPSFSLFLHCTQSPAGEHEPAVRLQSNKLLLDPLGFCWHYTHTTLSWSCTHTITIPAG